MERILRRTIHLLPLATRERLFFALKAFMRNGKPKSRIVFAATMIIMRNTLGTC